MSNKVWHVVAAMGVVALSWLPFVAAGYRPLDALFEVVADLGTYPAWLDIVGRAEPLDPATGADGTAEDAAWSVDLKGQVGPFRRSKRLRMVRACFDDPDATGRASVRFERRELDGRSHSDWVLSAELSTPASPPSRTPTQPPGVLPPLLAPPRTPPSPDPSGYYVELVDGLDALGLPSAPSHWRKNLMACTGIEYCKLSFAETRNRAQVLVPELEQRLEDLNSQLDVPITVNINGCPNSCARIQIADIGFKGQMVSGDEAGGGTPVEGFQVHLGGSLGLDSAFGRKLRQHKVTSAELGDYIERVVRNFVKHRQQGERFAQWAVRAAEEDLR